MVRDSNGNWGYAYTADEDNVTKAEQEYEDKLYEYQKLNAEYIDELNEMILDAQTTLYEELQDLGPNATALEIQDAWDKYYANIENYTQ